MTVRESMCVSQQRTSWKILKTPVCGGMMAMDVTIGFCIHGTEVRTPKNEIYHTSTYLG